MKNILLKKILNMSIFVTFLVTTLSALNFTTSITNRYNYIFAYGKINSGDLYKLSRIYKTLPKNRQTIVVFNSSGGELREGLKIGIYLKKHHIGSAVSKNGVCASSCALAFLGGRDLYGRKLMILPYGSKLGYHSFYYKDNRYVSVEKIQNDFSYLFKYFTYVGGPNALLSKMLDTKSSNMYWITQRNNRYLPLKKGVYFSKTNNVKNTFSKIESIKNYFNKINLTLRAESGYSNSYVALNYTDYNNWLAQNLRYIYISNIKVLKNNRVRVKTYYMLKNYKKICTYNTYKLKRASNSWNIVAKSVKPCNRYARRVSKVYLYKLP